MTVCKVQMDLFCPLVFLALLAVSLSGCLGSDGDEDKPDAPAPAAVISADATITYSGASVQFDGASSTGSDLKYQWDFGDGGVASAASVQHSYSKPGKYTVSLKVTDGEGRSNEALLVVHVHHLSQYSPTLSFSDSREDYAVEITAFSQGFRANLTYPSGNMNSVTLNMFLPNGTLYDSSSEQQRSSGPLQYYEIKVPVQTLAENGFENWKAQLKLSSGLSVACNLTIEVYY